jgi:hypothetical protein
MTVAKPPALSAAPKNGRMEEFLLKIFPVQVVEAMAALLAIPADGDAPSRNNNNKGTT